MTQIVLASGNKGKLAEFNQLFNQYKVQVLPQSEFDVPSVAETGTTFVENAIIKARHAAEFCKSPTISDDSGIEVDALNGQPGIYSARYSGENATETSNYEKLLEALKNVEARSARFQCVLIYMRHAKDPTPIIAQASWEGTIAYEADGNGGHGYDPIFIPEGSSQTVAHMDAQHKNSISHRGKALALLIDALKQQKIIG
ncbi:RdgB/HAM1 family non-canonical purine NTP pyrophosphatase [Parashewanella spongiae]|uniref:dITP/XTP pyrophosphatase n=1 Tax=Parashewanella spongiae TaxID=342950 RepID=A0A3A6TT90_9GAMM|nr:RdgB/HAM1 family non-canonical purine NTP pyrophosphatase [Parashewanella spongiae]MCL1078311.1 RdgB/HAM1 family non-canonical purine NTP pyrophosphatase [Parashewanella spongiae]RJY15034.1 RdgB/HAM1 family non-canonical purine NTP pyrophosphatase [Parashewanella spongiae]